MNDLFEQLRAGATKRLGEFAVIATLAATGYLGVHWMDDRIDDRLGDRLPELEQSMLRCATAEQCERRGAEIAELAKRLGELEKRTDKHITEGTFFRERYTQVEQMVRELYYQPAARPDKFTGTDGKKLREELEAQIQQLEVELRRLKQIP